MSGFDLLFSLLTLLLGLAMAEVLGDLGRVIDRRRKITIGWLTPLLAVVVLFDLTSFWMSAFGYRKLLAANDFSILGVLIFAGCYYLIATLVVPEDIDEVQNLDQHYWQNRRLVIGGIIVLNMTQIPMALKTGLDPLSWTTIGVFYALLLALFVARGSRANVSCLCLVLSIYILGPLAGQLSG